MIDKRKSLLNITVSMAFKIAMLVMAIVTKRSLIAYIGNDANGIYSLYSSIVGILSIADLGVGSAIAFSMYKPITEGDNKKVTALYCLFKKVYLVVGAVVLLGGLLILPFIPNLAKDYNSNFNLYIAFLIMLLSTVLAYGYSAQTTLINAYKNNYVTTTIYSSSILLRDALQIVVLVIFKSFELYLVCAVIATIIQWIWTRIYARKHYKEIITNKELLDAETKKAVVKNTKAMFMHKIGDLLINSIDSIIISSLIGVAILGKYSNYTVIVTAMMAVINLFFTPLTSVIGHLCAEGSKNEKVKYFGFFHSFNFVVGLIFFAGYFMIADDVIKIVFETERSGSLIMDKSVAFVITLNYFIQFMRNSVLLFRDATGTFYNDRWKPLFEGIANAVLSIVLVNFIGIVGVIVSTIITNVFISHMVEPYVLHKHGFETSSKNYYVRNYTYIAAFAAILIGIYFIDIHFENVWIDLLVRGLISVGITLVPTLLVFAFDRTFRMYLIKAIKTAWRKIFRRKMAN